jgi:prepilin-type N-terminal cleavage/methylation domain-containing protein
VRVTRGRDESGFTMIELLVAIVLFGVVVGMAVAPYSAYQLRQKHIGTARELVAFLRRAQVRAVAEETTYRVDITATSATMYRSNGTTYVLVQKAKPADSRITYSGASFLQKTGGTAASVTFYQKGSADKGSVSVVRSGSSKTYTISVEGLTARVSYA